MKTATSMETEMMNITAVLDTCTLPLFSGKTKPVSDVGAPVGLVVGARVGEDVGAAVGLAVGARVGKDVGAAVGLAVGASVLVGTGAISTDKGSVFIMFPSVALHWLSLHAHGQLFTSSWTSRSVIPRRPNLRQSKPPAAIVVHGIPCRVLKAGLSTAAATQDADVKNRTAAQRRNDAGEREDMMDGVN